MGQRISDRSPGARIRLHLEIRLQDGTEVLSSFDGEPIAVTVGDGTLAPELERLIGELKAGDDERFLVDGSDLYGPRDEANQHWIPASAFPDDIDRTPGTVVAFSTPGGQETAGIVLEAEPERVRVDLNHPLSGRSLLIRVAIIEVA